MTKLTKRTVDALQPGSKDYIVFDEDMAGFGVRVFPTGRKSFLVQYRTGGRTRRIKLGAFGIRTADEARQKAREILGDVAKGDDPAQDIHAWRSAPTVTEVCDRFIAEHVVPHCKPSTERDYRRTLNKVIKPKFGTRKIVDIARPDISTLHHELRSTPYFANRVLAVLSKMFNMVELWGLRPDGSNPCRHVKKFREQSRERFLSPDELKNLGRVFDEIEADGSEHISAVTAFRLLIFTGCRVSEIQTLKWEYIKGSYFFLPDTKTGARKIPISPGVQSVLDRIERIPGNPYLITGEKPGKYFHDLRHPWRRIRARAGLDGVRLHDLRHTFASHALLNGKPLEQVRLLLGHKSLQTALRYAHIADHTILDAATDVAASMQEIMSPSTVENEPPPPPPFSGDNVVLLRPPGNSADSQSGRGHF